MSLRTDTTGQFDAILGIIESRSIQTMKNSGNHLDPDSCKSILINVTDQTSLLPQLGNIPNNLSTAINPGDSSSLELYFLLDVGERSTTCKLYNKMQDI